MVKESLVQKTLIDLIRQEFPDIYLIKIHQSRFSHAGIPDLLGCLRGRFFAIEVKTFTGKATALQMRELRFIDNAGGLQLICHGIEGIERTIDELRRISVLR